MRPISEKQSFLRNPLNYVLGTEAQVRILRVLSQTQSPLSGSEIASQSDLTFRGASKALESLVEVEIVSYIGRERSKLYMLFNEHPLAPLLKRVLPGFLWVKFEFSAVKQYCDPVVFKVSKSTSRRFDRLNFGVKALCRGVGYPMAKVS